MNGESKSETNIMDKYFVARSLPLFEDYINDIINYSTVSPNEHVYQFYVIMPLLKSLLADDIYHKHKYQIVDTSDNFDTQKHTREYYTFKKEDNNIYPSPDVIIAENYVYNNINSDKPNIHSAIEVKEPFSDEMFKKNINNYKLHVIYELSIYLSVNERAILTNCGRWQFFKRTDSFDKVFARFFADVYRLMYEKKEEYIERLLKSVDDNDYIKEKLSHIDNESNLSKEEKANAYSKAIDKIARDQLKSCCRKTIDVISIRERIINVDDYCESIEPDEYVKELLGLKAQHRIKVPKEWYELINYIPVFIIGDKRSRND